MKIYSLGVKFPYVTASRLGKHHKDKGVNADRKCYFSCFGCLQEHFSLNLVKENILLIAEPLDFRIQWKIH